MNNETQVDKIPLVLYSGGMDSTFMLNRALLKGSADTLYVSCNGYGGREIMEKQARQKAQALFLREGNPLNLKGRVLNDRAINLDETLIHVKGSRLIQPLAWLIAGIMAFDKTLHSELQIGYIVGDTATAITETLKAFWRNAYASMHWCDPKDAPPVRFPLVEEGYSKIDVLTNLPHLLADKIWVCELPVQMDNGRYRYCKRCPSCRTHHHALQDYKDKYHWDYGAWVIHNRNLVPDTKVEVK